MQENLVFGVDFGTDSVRSVLIDADNGKEIASSISYYPRWKKGLYCDPAKNRFRQHPLDYIEGITLTIRECMQKSGVKKASVRAISVDTTGSSPVLVNRSGLPLALTPAHAENPNAMFVLWKDHTAIKEAAEINTHATKFGTNYLQFVGGIYSSEWFWAKLLHVLRDDESLHNEAFTFVEHCDWIPFLLTGGTDAAALKRSRCSAGHKALWAEEFDGLPPDDFFSSLDPLLADYAPRIPSETYTSDKAAGNLSAEWAEKLGLHTDVAIGIGAFDAHMGAVGGEIEPYYLSKVMGTSTCDILVAPNAEVEGTLVNGICGQVNGSVIPGMMGMEAGQSAFGDVYAWLRDIVAWPVQFLLPKTALIDEETRIQLQEELFDAILPELSRLASEISVDEQSELAIDWLNGRRTPDASQELKAAVTGLNLGTDTPRLFRALAESTCFGAKTIVERFEQEGVPVKGIIGIGGVAKKSPYIMQMMADVLNMPIRIHHHTQTCALGAAMFAATVAGIYTDVQQAMKAMGGGFDKTYKPDPEKVAVYARRYRKYLETGQFIEQQIRKSGVKTAPSLAT
ncbi:MAG: ribulokinase [Mucilaginibacter polytrichastri]|nr:ribulokinase [Mucilaginibacter polytrichastri]